MEKIRNSFDTECIQTLRKSNDAYKSNAMCVLDNSKGTIAVLLDFSAAFDTVDNDIL